MSGVTYETMYHERLQAIADAMPCLSWIEQQALLCANMIDTLALVSERGKVYRKEIIAQDLLGLQRVVSNIFPEILPMLPKLTLENKRALARELRLLFFLAEEFNT